MSFKVKDHYFNLAKKNNYLARSAFKLEEIDKKYSIINSGSHVLDLGYYPGSWIQYVLQKPKFSGMVTGVDIQEVNEGLAKNPRLNLYQMSIEDICELADIGVDKKFDVVQSDMAPKTTGIKTVDQLRSLSLVELVFYKLPILLKEGGDLVIKVFESQDAQNFFKDQKNQFEKINFLRPKSTRKVSKEYFVICKGYKFP